MMNPATGQSEAITINLPKSTIENLQLAGGNLALGEDGVTMLQGDYNQLLDIVLKNSNLQVGQYSRQNVREKMIFPGFSEYLAVVFSMFNG